MCRVILPWCVLSVLIDTWWNVNAADPTVYVFLLTVLIDTWWNVNEFNLFLSFIR